jgi:hypothetical protein
VMTSTTSSESSETMTPPLGAVRRWAGDHPTAVAAVAYGLTAVAAGVAAFYALFTQFASYDDEGTLLVALKAFADGQVLYRDIYTAYGPFFFEVFGGFFALTGWAVTNDASRLIVGLVWVASSVLFGVAAQRLTGRLALGIAATVVTFSALRVFAAEPMHPQVAIAPLMGGITLLVASGPGRRVALSGALVGALLAGLVLTKVNAGGYAVLAAVFATALAWEPLRSRRRLRLAAIAVLLLLPFLIMYPDLSKEWVRELAVLELFAFAAIAIAAHTARPLPRESDQSLRRWLLAAVAGAMAAGAAVLGILLLTGTTPAEVFDGTVTQGLKVRDAFMIPPSGRRRWNPRGCLRRPRHPAAGRSPTHLDLPRRAPSRRGAHDLVHRMGAALAKSHRQFDHPANGPRLGRRLRSGGLRRGAVRALRPHLPAALRGEPDARGLSRRRQPDSHLLGRLRGRRRDLHR